MPKTPPVVDFWTVKEAADYLRVCTKTIYELSRIPENKGGPPIRRPLDLHIRPERKKRKNKRAAIRFPREAFIQWANRETPCSA